MYTASGKKNGYATLILRQALGATNAAKAPKTQGAEGG